MGMMTLLSLPEGNCTCSGLAFSRMPGTGFPEVRGDVVQAHGQGALDIDPVVLGVTEEVRAPFGCALGAPVRDQRTQCEPCQRGNRQQRKFPGLDRPLPLVACGEGAGAPPGMIRCPA